MSKVPRTALRSWVARQLKVVQDGLCAICGKPCDLTVKGEGVADHNHDTGELRGVLHRSCNAAEGKIANAAARWGAKDSSYPAIISYLKRLLAYYEKPGCGVIYPMHKDADEKADERKAKAKLRRAEAKAKLALRGRKVTP